MLNPSASLEKPWRFLSFIGVFHEDYLVSGLRLATFMSLFYLPVTFCYSWSVVKYFNEYDWVMNMMYAIGVIHGFIKLVELKINHKQMARLSSNLEPLNFNIFKDNHESIIRESLNYVRKIFLFFAILMELTMLSLVSSWIVRKIFEKSDQRFLMIGTWTPYDYSTSPVYEVTVFIQMVSAACTTNSLVAFDALMFGLIHLMTTQIDILNVELTRLGYDNTKCVEVFENIKRCVIYNRTIVNNFSLLNSVVGMGLVSQLAQTALLVSMSLIMIQNETEVTFELCKTAFLAACVLFELFFFCHFGDKIIEKSNELCNSIYFSNWHQFECHCDYVNLEIRKQHTRSFKRSVLIIMCCVKGPIGLTAGKLLALNYETYVQIIKTGYSYYTVFRG